MLPPGLNGDWDFLGKGFSFVTIRDVGHFVRQRRLSVEMIEQAHKIQHGVLPVLLPIPKRLPRGGDKRCQPTDRAVDEQWIQSVSAFGLKSGTGERHVIGFSDEESGVNDGFENLVHSNHPRRFTGCAKSHAALKKQLPMAA